MYFIHIVTYTFCFTTHSCISCTLSPLFYVSLYRAVLHAHCHLFLMFHYRELYFMYIVTSFFIFHYTQSCTSCTLPPLFYVSLHTAVLHVHCHLFFMFHYTQLYFMYIVNSFLCFTTHSCTSCTLSTLFYVSLHTELYFMYIVTSFLYFTTGLNSCTWSPLFYVSLHTELYFHVHFHLFFLFHYTQSCPSCTLSPLFLCFTTAF
jgi:hypothetical protein